MSDSERSARVQKAVREILDRLSESEPKFDELVAGLAAKYEVTEEEIREAWRHVSFNFRP